MRALTFAIAASLATAAVAEPVAVLVAIPIPAAMPQEKLRALFAASQPEYRALPGLIRKYYTIGDDNAGGGIYLFASRAAAEAHFSAAWKDGVLKRWGKPAVVSYFTVPIVLDGTNVGGAPQ